jgi:hypothetical protein
MQITIKELNKPSSKALKAFNQHVFNAIQKHCNSQEQKSEVKVNE